MPRTEERSTSDRRDDLFLAAATVVFVAIAFQSTGWLALVMAILATGLASGVMAGAVFDMHEAPVAPAPQVRHQRPAA